MLGPGGLESQLTSQQARDDSEELVEERNQFRNDERQCPNRGTNRRPGAPRFGALARVKSRASEELGPDEFRRDVARNDARDDDGDERYRVSGDPDRRRSRRQGGRSDVLPFERVDGRADEDVECRRDGLHKRKRVLEI